MSNRITDLLVRNQKTVAALPGMSASEKFSLLTQLEQERRDTRGVGEVLIIMDLHRVIEQELWSWGLQAALAERDDAPRRKPLAAYLQQKGPLIEQLQEIRGNLPAISPADKFTLMTLLNERIHSDAKPRERLAFLDLYQLTRQSLWVWLTEKALHERIAGRKKKSAKKAPVKKSKPPAKKKKRR